MTYDERDPRDMRPEDDPERVDRLPDEEAEFENLPHPAGDEAPPEAAPPEPPAEAAQDRWSDEASRREEPPPMAEEQLPGTDDTVADQVAARIDAAEEAPGDAGPPPPDVEAYAAPPDATEPLVAAHSVPATQPGESTQCPRCGTENRPGIAFCRNCGQRLVAAGAPATVERPSAPDGTQACPRCGTHNRAGVAFCQNCGANLRVAETGYVPPAVADEERVAVAPVEAERRAILGPIVLLIGAIGIGTAWLLPFLFGDASLYERAFGADGYGVAFWNAYDGIEGLASQAYFGFAAPAPMLVALLVLLAIGGMVRAAPGILQLIGLVSALVWAIGLAALFVVVEVLGGPGGELLDILRSLTPAGIIFLLASLIVVIGVLTRFGRG